MLRVRTVCSLWELRSYANEEKKTLGKPRAGLAERGCDQRGRCWPRSRPSGHRLPAPRVPASPFSARPAAPPAKDCGSAWRNVECRVSRRVGTRQTGSPRHFLLVTRRQLPRWRSDSSLPCRHSCRHLNPNHMPARTLLGAECKYVVLSELETRLGQNS